MRTTQQFRKAVEQLRSVHNPVQVHIDCGPVHFEKFLHVDVRKMPKRHLKIYNFNAAEPWRIP